MLNIEEKQNHRIALHHLGFRPFFLAGSLFAVIGMLLWLFQYHFNILFPVMDNLPIVYWHGHEMIFGYAMAVIGGFLLTAVRNWTNVQTLHGWPLLLLALLWLLARLMPFIDHPSAMLAMTVLDLGFNGLLCIALLYPILKVRQWTQIGIWLNVVFICTANLLFYFGLFGLISNGMEMGLYAGLYFIISLIMLMGRRVIPFFIEKGVDETVTLKNSLWLDNVSIVLVVAFIYLQVFTHHLNMATTLAFSLTLLHLWRITAWHTKGIWQKPLLWILYLAYASIVVGFIFTGLANLQYLSPLLATHAFGYGGIGLMTLGMMARVALGHTGRNVFDPPRVLFWVFTLAVAGAIARVGLPLLAPTMNTSWIGLSQGLWIIAFGTFSWVYAPMLIKARVDGRYG